MESVCVGDVVGGVVEVLRGWMERGTPEEGGSSPARCHLPLADTSSRQEKHAGDGSGLGVLS